MLLAGDIGGTNTRLALFRDDGATLALAHSASYESRSFSTLEEIVLRFLRTSKHEPVRAACFAVAGAVVGGQVRATNLPWVVRDDELERRLMVPRVTLMNDLEAAAHGVLAISDESDLLPLQWGEVAEEHGALALVAAGTGLGVALMQWDGTRYQVSPSEGGHASFAPQDEVQDALLVFLRAEFGHVSFERVVSGPGLANVYRFLREYRGVPEPRWLTERIGGGDPSPVISAAALAHEDDVCDEALSIFASVYGAAAGSVALTALAMGGVLIGGGIAPKILPRLRDGLFLDAFAHKGRFSDAMRRIPVQVVLAPNVALLGAAEGARKSLAE
ncbi:MAG TPA: glucokinase [Gemmatimonadaceae bacterium]|nr:glucokinase [Gemmatimonadaceae bacterium]